MGKPDSCSQGVSLPSADTATKRSIYERRKKSKLVSMEINHNVEDVVDVEASEDSEPWTNRVENVCEDSFSALSDEGMSEDEDDDDEWDSKSWDDLRFLPCPLRLLLTRRKKMRIL